MSHLFIINPFAGDGSYKRIEEVLHKLVKTREDVLIETSRYPGHCSEILEHYCNKDVKRIYSVGGDGSFHDLVNCLIRQKLSDRISVGIIPSGSGNDYIKNFTKLTELSMIKNDWEYIHELLEAEVLPVDIGRANDDYFLNVMSVGFDAQVIENSYLFKKNIFVPSKSSYFLSAMYTLMRLKNYSCEIRTNTGEKFEKFMMVSIGKGKYYGGGMKVLPHADTTDGLLDICVVSPLKRRSVFPLIKTFMEGKHERLSVVSLLKSEGLQIRSKEIIPYQLDGELRKGDYWDIEIIPKAISLIKPL